MAWRRPDIGGVQAGSGWRRPDIGGVQAVAAAPSGTVLPQITSAYMSIFIKIFIVLLVF